MEEHIEGPTIVEQVMLDVDQHMFLLTEAQQSPSYQWKLSQVEWLLNFLAHKSLSRYFTLTLGQRLKIHYQQIHRLWLVNDLNWPTIYSRKGGPVDFMAAHDFPETPLEHCYIKEPREPESCLEVIGYIGGI